MGVATSAIGIVSAIIGIICLFVAVILEYMKKRRYTHRSKIRTSSKMK
jgi:predicted histidine transporter YuiF (NhaC family)